MVTTIRLPDELHEDLKRQAELRGMTFNAYLLSILWETRKSRVEQGMKRDKV